MKVKRGKKDFWTPAAPLRVDGADPKARLVRVSPLWSTAAWSTATAGTAGLDLSYGFSGKLSVLDELPSSICLLSEFTTKDCRNFLFRHTSLF